jgi:hypothetical protein
VLLFIPVVILAAIFLPRARVRQLSEALLAEVAKNAARGERLLAGPVRVSWRRSYGIAAVTNQRYVVWMGGVRREVTFDGVSSFREETKYRTMFILSTPHGEQRVLAPSAELEQFRAALTQALGARQAQV